MRGNNRGGGGFRGGRGRGGFRGGGGGGKPPIDQNYPQSDYVLQLGQVMHSCQSQLVVKMTMAQKVPMFFRPVFLKSNEKKIGVVEEIFGVTQQQMFSVKCDQGIVASSLKKGSTVYFSIALIIIVMNYCHVMPIQRFTKPRQAVQRASKPLNLQGQRVKSGNFGFKDKRGGGFGGRGFRGGGGGGRFQSRGGGGGRGFRGGGRPGRGGRF